MSFPLDLTQRTAALRIPNEEMKDIIKIVKSLEKSGLLVKGTSETCKNEAIEQKAGFLGILFGTLGAILLATLLTRESKIVIKSW